MEGKPNMRQLAKYKIILMFLFFGISIKSQVVVPDLEVPGYESNFMREVYGRSYFAGSLSNWNEQVLYYQDMLRASWEDQVDEAIFDYVNTITTGDSVNDVEAYKDYVLRELESQKSVALTNWQETANLDLLSNREQFLTRLTSSQLDESYISRMGMTEYYNQVKSYQEAQRLQTEIQAAANSWSQNFNQNFQQGISDFTTAFSSIESNYQNLLNSIDSNDQAFQANLTAINEYKSFVKDSIRSVLTSFEEELGKACTERYGCVYREANGDLNAAGLKLQSLVDQIKPKLNDNSINPTMELTIFSQQVRDFLIDQQIGADSEFNRYNPWINSLQTDPFTQYTLSDNVYDSGYAYSDTTKSNLISSVMYGDYEYWSGITRQSWWTGEGDNDPALINLVNALQADYNNGDTNYTQLSAMLRGNLGPDKVLTQIHMANAYARDREGRNNAKFMGVPIAYVQRSGFEGNMLAGANNFAFFGIPGQTNWNQWAALRCAPIGCIVDHHQLDSVIMAITYSVKDLVVESQANYWKSIDSSMQGQVGKYNNEILPAVQNWEAQVANYDRFYTEWKVQADVARERAQADYEASLASLEAEKQAWIANSQNEYRDGYLQWSELSANAQSGKAVPADIKTEIRNISSSNTFASIKPVGLNTLVESFNSNLETIANQGFTFTDQPADSFLNATTRLQAGETNTGNYTLLGAYNQKTINTSLEIGGKEYSSIIQGTTTGIYQYSQLISVNDSNKQTALREQEKLLNQNSWNIEYASIEIGKMVDGLYQGTGLKDEVAINNILKEFNNSARYQISMENCQKEARVNVDCFSDVVHKGRIEELSKLGYEYKEGKVVRKLDRSEEIRLGTFKDYQSLTQAEKEEYGSCYVDPSLCKTTNGKSLLRKDFDYTIDKQANIATLTRVINSGQIARRDGENFINGTQVETRSINLAQVKSVMAPKGKDLFDTWGQEDWEDFSTQSSDKLKSFYEVGLVAVGRTTQNAVASIRKIESHNEKKFQNTVEGIKTQESMLKELALAYLTGGMAGVQAALKGKVEDKINSSLAEAFIRATGGTMEDVQRVSDAFSFVRGRIEQNKIKSRENYYSVNDLGGSMERYFKNIDPITSTARRLVEAAPQIPFFGPMITTMTGVGLAVTKEIVGDKQYNSTMDRVTARKDRLVEIKANERSMAKSYVDKAISEGSGISLELVSQQSTDFLGARDAARVRNANNARWGVLDQAVGVVGGIVKTAFNAFGMKDRDFAAALKDGNRLLFAGSVETTYGEKAALAGANQYWGMSGPGLSYQTNVLKIGDNKGIVKEFGQQALVTAIAKAQGWDKDIVNSIVRKEYGKYEQRQTDKKVQADAIRDTAKLAATILLPGGIAAIAGQFAGMAGQIGQIATRIADFADKSSKVFNAIVRGAVQVVDGTRNGINGVAAGLGNAVLGVMGASGVFDFGTSMGIFSQSAVGLGISYDKDRGYGGMIGIGNSTTNASVGFYQHGATSLDASYGVSDYSQVTLSHSGNSTQVGMNVNGGEGDRKGFNLSLNYDIQQGMASGGIGYTMSDDSNPFNKMGINLNFDRYGMTSSAQYDGINLASMGPAGFSMQEIDWAMLNINEAQDRQKFNQDKTYLASKPGIDLTKIPDSEIENLAATERGKDKLIAEGVTTPENLRSLTPEQIAAKVQELENKHNAENTAGGAAATSTALFLLGYLGIRRNEDDVKTPSEDKINEVKDKATLKIDELKKKLESSINNKEKNDLERKISRLETERDAAIKDIKIKALDNPVSIKGQIPDFSDSAFEKYSFDAKKEVINKISTRLIAEIDAQIKEANNIDSNDKRVKERVRLLEKEKVKLTTEINKAKIGALTKLPQVSDILTEINSQSDLNLVRDKTSELKTILLTLKAETKDLDPKDKNVLARNQEIDKQIKIINAEITKAENASNIRNLNIEDTFARTPVEGLSEAKLRGEQKEFENNKKLVNANFERMIEAAKKSDKKYIEELKTEHAKAKEIMNRRGADLANQLAELHIAPLRDLLSKGGAVEDFAKKFDNLTAADKRLVYQESLRLGNDGEVLIPYSSAFIPVGNGEKVFIDVVDTPKHYKFSDSAENRKTVDTLKDAIQNSIEGNSLKYENNLEYALDSKTKQKYEANKLEKNKQDTLLKKATDELRILNMKDPFAFSSTDPAIRKEYDTLKKQMDTARQELAKLKTAENSLLVANQKLIDKQIAIQIAGDLVKNQELAPQLEPKLKTAVEAYNKAKENYEKLISGSIINPDKMHPDQALLNTYKKAFTDAEAKLLLLTDPILEIKSKLKGKDDFASTAEDVKRLFIKDSIVDTIPETTKKVELPIFQNPQTGEFRIGGGDSALSLAANSGPGSDYYQDPSNGKALEMADQIRNALNIDASVPSSEIVMKWCQAASLWATCRKEFGAAVPDNFVDFITKHKDSITIKPGDVMYVTGNNTIMNSYASQSGKEWHRDTFKDTNPSITRDQAYAKIAEAMQTTTSNSVMIRISSGHTISIHRDGPGSDWIVKDTGHKETNGSIVDPARIRDSILFDDGPYENNIPESIAFPVVKK